MKKPIIKIINYFLLTELSLYFYGIVFYNTYGYNDRSTYMLFFINAIILSPLMNYLIKLKREDELTVDIITES